MPNPPSAPELPAAWIVHREADLLVINKPAGLLAQPGLGPAQADSLLSRLRRHWPAAELVHRLDRDTSGLLLVALEPALHRALSALFAQRAVHKRYLADVEGVPGPTGGTIALPLAKRQHRPPLYGPDPLGKPCCTRWRLLAADPSGRRSRLELRPRTGRSHQLRVHLSAIGHPILGDPLYGRPASSPLHRLHLHASGLRFRHPISGRPLAFAAACPF